MFFINFYNSVWVFSLFACLFLISLVLNTTLELSGLVLGTVDSFPDYHCLSIPFMTGTFVLGFHY